jgi:hypothetical protein
MSITASHGTSTIHQPKISSPVGELAFPTNHATVQPRVATVARMQITIMEPPLANREPNPYISSVVYGREVLSIEHVVEYGLPLNNGVGPMERKFGSHEGDPATWIAGTEGSIFLDGKWKPFDSIELAHNAKLMSHTDFVREFPEAAKAFGA